MTNNQVEWDNVTPHPDLPDVPTAVTPYLENPNPAITTVTPVNPTPSA